MKKPADDEPMTRRNVYLPDWMWRALEDQGYDLTAKERRPVSASEALRRIVERSLARSK